MKKMILLMLGVILLSSSAFATIPYTKAPNYTAVSGNLGLYNFVLWNTSIALKGSYALPLGSLNTDASGFIKSPQTIMNFNISPSALGNTGNYSFYWEAYKDSAVGYYLQQGDYTDDNPYNGQFHARTSGLNFTYYSLSAYNNGVGWVANTEYHICLTYDNTNQKFSFYIMNASNSLIGSRESLSYNTDLRATYSHSFKFYTGDSGNLYWRKFISYNGTCDNPPYKENETAAASPETELDVLNASYQRNPAGGSNLIYEGSEIYYMANHTLSGVTLLGSVCNFTAYNISYSGGLKTAGNVSLTPASPSASFKINENNASMIRNLINFKACKENSPPVTLEAHINNSLKASYSSEIPLCSAGSHNVVLNGSGFISENVSLTCASCPANTIKILKSGDYNIRYFREFYNYSETMPYNATRGFYSFTEHAYTYLDTGLKGVNALCNGTSDFMYNNVLDANLTARIVSINDSAFINNSLYEAGDLSVIIDYSGLDILSYHTNLTNGSGSLIMQYFTEFFIINNSQMPKNGIYYLKGYAVDNEGYNISFLGAFNISDTAQPEITINSPNEGNSTTAAYGVNYNFQSTADDLNLFAHEMALYAPNGSLMYLLNKTDINTTSDTISFSYVLDTAGCWRVSANATDDHTINEMLPLATSINKEKMTYGNIQIEAIGALGCSNEKLKDRYSFECSYNKTDLSPIKDYKVVSTNPLILRPNSGLKGHMVDYTAMLAIDFENEAGKASIKRISDKEITVSIVSSAESIKFNSIVGLNWASKDALICVSEKPADYTLLNFDLSKQTNVLLLGVLAVLYLGCMAIGFTFKNFGFSSLGFFIGIVLGLLLSSMGLFMTFLFLFINIGIFIGVAKGKR